MTASTTPNRRTGLILLLVASLGGNAYLFTANRTLAMKLDQSTKSTTQYREAYRATLDKDLMLTRDFTAMYVANVRQLQSALQAGKQREALDSLDSANFFAGFLSRYTRDGNHYSSADYAGNSGGLSQADSAKLNADIARAQSKADQVQQFLQASRDQEPGAETAAMPNGAEAPAAVPAMPKGVAGTNPHGMTDLPQASDSKP